MLEEENENIAIHYIDETVIRVGREVVVVWLWMDGLIAIEPKSKSILDMYGLIAIEPKSKSILDMYACVFL
jgi:hypothetical protein